MGICSQTKIMNKNKYFLFLGFHIRLEYFFQSGEDSQLNSIFQILIFLFIILKESQYL